MATLAFYALTLRTHYPFLADDYHYAWQAYMPNYNLHTFHILVTRRPLSSLLNFYTYGAHVFEKTKILFLIYFLLHSWAVITIFRKLCQKWIASISSSSMWAMALIEFLICLYPDLFENTLMALNLPYTLGAFFLALTLVVEDWKVFDFLKWPLRLLFVYATYCCLETWILTSAVVYFLYCLRPKLQIKLLVSYALTCMLALACFLATEHALGPHYGGSSYDIALDGPQFIINFKTTQELLWLHGFYKINWISTGFDFIAMAILLFALVKKRSFLLPAMLLLAPFAASAHQWLYNIFAPRSIHGGMIIRAILVGVALMWLWQTCQAAEKKTKWICCYSLLLLAYLAHFVVITNNRSTNEHIMAARQSAIEQQLQTCTEPCTIHLYPLNKDLLWDWYLSDPFRSAYVEWINNSGGFKKKLNLIE